MRLKAFELRQKENNMKPHMPLINEDVKQAMIKEYFDAKRQLRQIWFKNTSIKLFINILFYFHQNQKELFQSQK